jgi:hypothetical protein
MRKDITMNLQMTQIVTLMVLWKIDNRNFGNTAKFHKLPRLFQKYDNKRFHLVSYCQGLRQLNIT